MTALRATESDDARATVPSRALPLATLLLEVVRATPPPGVAGAGVVALTLVEALGVGVGVVAVAAAAVAGFVAGRMLDGTLLSVASNECEQEQQQTHGDDSRHWCRTFVRNLREGLGLLLEHHVIG